MKETFQNGLQFWIYFVEGKNRKDKTENKVLFLVQVSGPYTALHYITAKLVAQLLKGGPAALKLTQLAAFVGLIMAVLLATYCFLNAWLD